MAKALVTDPRAVSLPPLRDSDVIRPDGDREVTLLSAGLPTIGPGFALFGTMDVRGRGSHVEPSPHCDPFVMATAASVPVDMKLPFCAHPHCGASVSSILFQGTAVRPWDNINGTFAPRILRSM